MTKTQEFIRFTHEGYNWLADPSFAPVVESDPRVYAPEGKAVKSGPARTVWHFTAEVAGAPTAVYVKRYFTPDVRDRLRYAVQPSKAWREYRAAKELLARGINAPEPLAIAVKRRGPVLSGAILVTRGLGDVVPLDVYVLARMAEATHAEVRGFTLAFAAFLRRLHDAGLLHRDFHAGNILVGGEPASPVFSVVDLHDVRLGAPLIYGERVDNLAVLGRLFCQITPRHWRLRFLEAYLAGGADVARAARLIEDLASRGMRQNWLKRDSRICGVNKHFRHVLVGPFAARARTGPLAAAALRLFEKGDPFDRAEAVLKDSRSSKVGVFAVETPDGPRRVLVKRRNPRRDVKVLLDPCRSSRAMLGFFHGAAFEHRQLPTPHVIAALEDRVLGFLKVSYLVQEYVDGAENLASAAAAGKASPMWRAIEADRKGFLRRLAHVLRRMHWCGFSMRDLKAANILVHPLSDGRPGIMVADLDAARLYPGGVPESRAVQNLARLYFDAAWLGVVTRREAIMFLNEYLGYPPRVTLLKWVYRIARNVRDKRETFVPKGVFAERQGRSSRSIG